MVLAEQPKEIVIIGAGAIGIEFAYFFNAFGTKVTVVEMMPHILPVEDDEVSKTLEKSFKKQGITILTNTKVTGTKDTGSGVEITVEGKETQVLKADTALIAIGVAPVLPGGPGADHLVGLPDVPRDAEGLGGVPAGLARRSEMGTVPGTLPPVF